jgi:hypothetical protein
VGRKKEARDDEQGTPPRKIRSKFCRYKHTLLHFCVEEFSEACLAPPQPL